MLLLPKRENGWPQAQKSVCTSPLEAMRIALVLTSPGLQHRALRRLESGFFCPGKYVCMLWAGQCFVSERKRPRIAEMDCAGKRCLRSRVCPATPPLISASAGQSTTIIALQVRRGPEFAEVRLVRLKCHNCFVTDRSLSLTVVRHVQGRSYCLVGGSSCS